MIKRWLVKILAVVLALAIVLGAAGVWTVRRSFPQVSGQARLEGLQGPVEVYRDAYGVPHIYAASEHDLFMAQGYVHAQDRFWQMDFWRHIGSGRLSEMFGAGQVETDTFLRTLGWRRVAEQELAALDPQSREILDAYSQGINAYLAERRGSALSLEYAVLGLMNRGYQPEPWQPVHSLTWAKAMAWDLRGNMDEEIERAHLLKTLSLDQVSELLPGYPADHPVIVPGDAASGAALRPAQPAGYNPAALAGLQQAGRRAAGLAALLGPFGSGIGSNSWVISGQRTATGSPLLANDPHLGIQMPSIWYQIGLHCRPQGPGCRFDAAGFSFAGVPGVVIGHNQRIGWGFTNVGPDVQDLYIEKINPQNPNQYEVDGAWQEMTLVQETIQVAGGDPVPVTVRYTRHGPLISESYGDLEGFAENTGGVDVPAQYAVALRWTALEPSHTFPAIWKLDLAENWQQFREAAALFDVPSQNLVYADLDGNIGYQTPGKIPQRKSGDGMLPVPGWTSDHEWTGYIPFEELPRAFNPPQGYIVTANNAVVGQEYPYLLSTSWDYGYRAARIVELIESAADPLSVADMQRIQGDDKDLSADFLLPPLLALPLDDPRLQAAREILRGWDGQMHMDSAPAALYAAFWRHLLAITFNDDLPEDQWPEGGSRWVEVVRGLVNRPDSPWWDEQATPARETLPDVFRAALQAAVGELEQLQGKNPAGWRWGELHTATFENATLGQSGIGPIEALFNRGPFPAAGGQGIVNATGWSTQAPYAVDWLPSMRMLLDFSDLTRSLAVHTTGQSGHAYHPHYIDMADRWRLIQYNPMLWSDAQVMEAPAALLRLEP